MTYHRISLFSLLILFAFKASAIAPILPSITVPFANPVNVGSSSTITYTFKNQLPLTLINPLVIEKTGNPASEFTYEDNCTGKRLTPNEICTVKVTLSPTTVGQKRLQLLIAIYDSNRVPLHPQTITAIPAEPS